MELISTHHVSCNVDAPNGAALLIVLTRDEFREDYAAYQGIVTLPKPAADMDAYTKARTSAAWRVASGGMKLREAEARRYWENTLHGKEYRA